MDHGGLSAASLAVCMLLVLASGLTGANSRIYDVEPTVPVEHADPRLLESGCSYHEYRFILNCKNMRFVPLKPSFSLPSKLKHVMLSDSNFNDFKRLLKSTIKPALITLSIKNSSLKSLRDMAGMFDFTRTRELEFINNHIPKLESNAFQKLRANNVQELTIKSSELSRLPNKAFSYLKSVETIDLTGNRIETLKNGTFKNLSKLRVVLLTNNPLGSSLEKPISPFQDCVQLEELYMEDCNITGFNPSFFKGLDSLTTLGLSRNKLLIISHNWRLPGTINTLVLRENMIHTIEEGSIEHLEPFMLALQGNRLTTLTLNLQKFFIAKIPLVFLYNNPWNCNCMIEELINHVRKLNDTGFTCANLNNSKLMETNLADPKTMKCEGKGIAPSPNTTTTNTTAANTTAATTDNISTIAPKSSLLDLLQKKVKLLKKAQNVEKERYDNWRDIVSVELGIVKKEAAMAKNE